MQEHENKKSSITRPQDDPKTFRPYPVVWKWWNEWKADSERKWKLNQALNMGLSVFMGKQQKELEDLHKYMRGIEDKESEET